MNFNKIYTGKKPVFSFEVFPPKTEQGIENLLIELEKLRRFDPAFISVTYGAGGTTQGRSLQILERLTKEKHFTVLPHLTCIGSSEASILSFMEKIKSLGISNVLALRGDCPQNNPNYHPESDFFKHASDLIDFIKLKYPFDIAVAGFPEVHPESESLSHDLKHMKAKVEKGAGLIITQLFFNNEDYYDYVREARAADINVPIIPGIMPITTLAQLKKIPELCDSLIPEELIKKIENAKSDEEIKEIGIAQALKQIRDLLNNGVPGIHLYPLNKAEAVSKVLDLLNKKS